jgi:predicted TIM-barrel fold metal-dependent hydrolase
VLDLDGFPVIDHHCHPFEPEMAALDPESLARAFYHGSGDISKLGGGKRRLWGATDDLRYHFSHMGVVHTMVCQLSKLFDCPAELEAVASERNRRTSESFAAYVRMLYEDAGIVGTVLDTGLAKNDPLLDLIPGRLMRLFQMDSIIDRLLEQAESYQELLHGYREILDLSVRQEGFVGVKSHLAERVGFGIEPVSDAEAEAIFPAVKASNSEAYKKLYVAIFTATLLQCQELGVPVHLHSGVTGGLTWDGPISNADPFLLAPLIGRSEFLRTRIVLLHAGYPWMQHAAELAHALPHVWVDMGWTTPWISLRIAECIRDVIGIAPLSKVTIGSGAHGTPEIAWLAAKTAKIALEEVFGDAVRLGLMAPKQAEGGARMILHDNAARMYGLE